MRKPGFILFFLFTILSQKIFSQADISMATHWYNRANYNPASIARTNYLYLFTNVRQQWVNVAGAPQVLNLQTSFYNENLKSAFGLSFVNDQIGLSQAINPMLTYAYRMTEEDNWSLSFGASAGIFSRSYNSSLFDPLETDPLITGTEVNLLTVPDVNVGVEFQSKSIISGMSATHILNRNVNDNSYINTSHKYAYVIYKNTDLELVNFYIGSLMVNRSNLTVFEFNGSVRFKNPTGLNAGSKELFDVGLTYRTSKILTLLFGFNISENIRVGYAYDQSFVAGLSLNGSHEIMLEYRIPLKSAQCEVCRNTEYWYR